MATPKEKIATGFIKYEGVVFNAADVASMSEVDFIASAKAQSEAMQKDHATTMNYSDRGAMQDDLLKGAWKAATEATKQPEPAVPSAQNPDTGKTKK